MLGILFMMILKKPFACLGGGITNAMSFMELGGQE